MRGVLRDDAIAGVGGDEVADQAVTMVAHQARPAVGVAVVANGLGTSQVITADHIEAAADVVVDFVR